MRTFCLVHGSTQTATGWELLAAELKLRGHDSICVDLPTGHPDASATVYAQAISAALDGVDGAMVVGHSASGLFLPLVPEYASVSRLIYLAAVLPQPGESFFGQIQRSREMYKPDFLGKNPVADESLALQYLFHDCSPEVAKWALSTLRLLFARGAVMEETPLRAWPKVPSSYISCTAERVIDPDWFEKAARERLQAEPIRIEAGHCPHVSRPAELAEILDSLAQL
jgi:pimeloyl-ACP methyl ester carboxylesterase